MRQDFRVLGKVTRRKDGIARVTGQEQFSSDISLPNAAYFRQVKNGVYIRMALIALVMGKM